MNDFFEQLTDICHNLLFDDKCLLKYLYKRNINNKTIKLYKLGIFPKDLRILFSYISPEELKKRHIIWRADRSPFENYPLVIPIKNVYGKIIAIGCRSLLNDFELRKKGIPKYRNSIYQKSTHLFNLDKAVEHIRGKDKVFVVEGYFDVISAYQKNIKNIVATCGIEFSIKQLILLSRYTKNICLKYDNDEAGRLNVKRIIRKIDSNPIINDINLTYEFTPLGYKDMDEYLNKNNYFNLFENDFDAKIKILW